MRANIISEGAVKSAPTSQTQNVEEVKSVKMNRNEVGEEKKGGVSSLAFWLTLGLLYILWDFIVLRNTKINEIVKPSNIRANLYNIVLIGTASVIFINGFKVLLVKVGALKIPLVSTLADRLLPLFQL